MLPGEQSELYFKANLGDQLNVAWLIKVRLQSVRANVFRHSVPLLCSLMLWTVLPGSSPLLTHAGGINQVVCSATSDVSKYIVPLLCCYFLATHGRWSNHHLHQNKAGYISLPLRLSPSRQMAAWFCFRFQLLKLKVFPHHLRQQLGICQKPLDYLCLIKSLVHTSFNINVSLSFSKTTDRFMISLWTGTLVKLNLTESSVNWNKVELIELNLIEWSYADRLRCLGVQPMVRPHTTELQVAVMSENMSKHIKRKRLLGTLSGQT